MSDGKILENDVPVFLVQFSTQEVLMFRNAKTGEITVGADDKVEQCTYVAAITRIEEELTNDLTGGWKVIEVNHLARCFLSVASHDFCYPRWHGGAHGHIFKTITLAFIHYIITTIDDYAITTLHGFTVH